MSAAETFSEAEGRLVFRRQFTQAPDLVWPYLVEHEFRKKWLCGGDVAPEPGGRIEFKFDPEDFGNPRPDHVSDTAYTADFNGEVVAYDPPRKLSFTWPSGEGFEDTLITFELSAKNGGTEFIVTHERIGRRSDLLGSAAGWHAHLDMLEDHLSGERSHNFFTRHEELEAFYEAELKAKSKTA